MAVVNVKNSRLFLTRKGAATKMHHAAWCLKAKLGLDFIVIFIHVHHV